MRQILYLRIISMVLHIKLCAARYASPVNKHVKEIYKSAKRHL